ncbi:TetR/AcrR family transcriptional regulator [Kribbella albertanoniae]|uniref:TetR/AcrR family transcriptional regulator n=1 Tax=Kribbella albertanoniae TaxID=1266829 RepID=A0A4R4Q425_9ACTN|nr:TetR/AcrR family transcriptional regulator [Kribbella albertanoniae]TDC29808.1 TetR/AcrR family transcriptional regulator [Kribbella albertanoniae]
MTVPTRTPRERLLDAAGELFYLEGVHIGVDAVCTAAGVSKKSMYQLFRSKDALIADSLTRVGVEFLAALAPSGNDERSPRERILHLFERQDQMSNLKTFRGCPFVNTATELKQPDHPGSVVARAFKQQMTDFFHTETIAAGIPDPDKLASELTMVFDGASAWAVVRAQPLRGAGVAMASALLSASGLGTSVLHQG